METKTAVEDARRRYIDLLRSMNPDPVLADRLDKIEAELDEAGEVGTASPTQR